MWPTLRFLLALLMLSPVFMQVAHADDAGGAYIVSYLEAAPAYTHEVRGLLRKFGAASRKDEGSLRFEVLQRRSEPNHFAVLELWKDPQSQAAHATAAHTKEFRDKLQPLLRSPYDERPHTGLGVAAMQMPAAKAQAAAIYAVTHVDVIPTQKDVGIALVQQLSEAARKDEGNIRFDALQQTSRPNHMTVVEIWNDQKALDAHGVAARTKLFREKLTPLSGSLYDERLYKVIN
jgi:quinol monooxygenase YgiN